jgi:hypothetical protein
MSLYRQAGRARRNRRAMIIGAIGLVVIVAVIVVLATSGGGPPSHADRVKSAKSAASEALDGVELLTVEYPQANAPTEFAAAKADVQRASQSLSDHRADFEAVDAAAYRRATAALAALTAVVARRGDITSAVRAARAALQPFAA